MHPGRTGEGLEHEHGRNELQEYSRHRPGATGGHIRQAGRQAASSSGHIPGLYVTLMFTREKEAERGWLTFPGLYNVCKLLELKRRILFYSDAFLLTHTNVIISAKTYEYIFFP